MPEIRNKKGEKNYNDVKKRSKVEIIQDRCRNLFEETKKYASEWSEDKLKEFIGLDLVYSSLLRNNENNLRMWQNLMNEIVVAICNDIEFPNFVDLLEDLKRKESKIDYYYGTAKLKEIISNEQKKSKESAVIDKVVQNKLSQKD